ncbi:unnamed protein product, partial [Allacma fusca]
YFRTDLFFPIDSNGKSVNRNCSSKS